MICIDFETRSETDIAVGPSRYSLDADILCLAYSIDDSEPELWQPGEKIPADLVAAISRGDEVFAHNVSFEIAIWNNVLVAKYGFPVVKDEQWRCTMAECCAAAIPRSLAESSRALGSNVEKDLDGRKLMLKMSKPRKPTKNDDSKWHDSPEDRARLGEYCKQDVRTEMANHHLLPRLSNRELAIFRFDRKVNQRGVLIDSDLAESALHLWKQHCEILEAELKKITDNFVSAGKEVAKMIKFLETEGVDVTELDKATVERQLARTDITERARRILELRAELALSSVSKYEKMLDCVEPDGRIRGSFLYHGAQTGRWAGQLVQLQNLPRGLLKAEEIDFFVQVVKARDLQGLKLLSPLPVGILLSSLLRSAFMAPPNKKLIVCDFAGVEARGVAWAANEKWLINAFRDGSDIYKEMAGAIYNKPVSEINKDERFVGKTCLAPDTKVVTDSGIKKLVDVAASDRLWDGVEWVRHKGICHQGHKEVWQLCGVKMTPDHLVMVGPKRWVRWENACLSSEILKQVNDTGNGLFSGLKNFSSKTDQEYVPYANVNVGSKKQFPQTDSGTVSQEVVENVAQKKIKHSLTKEGLLTDSSEDFGMQYRGATTLNEIITNGMVVGALWFLRNGVKIPIGSLNTQRLLIIMISMIIRWIGLTIARAMSQETSDLSPQKKTNGTCDALCRYMSELQNLSKKFWNCSPKLTLTKTTLPVYDILNAGPRHRFTIVTDAGPIIVHNCILGAGYGLGAQGFQNSLANYKVQMPLDFCQRVIDAYRTKNSATKSLWYAIENAAVSAVRYAKSNKVFSAGPYKFYCQDRWLKARLPVGRDICYYKPELTKGKYGDQVSYWGVSNLGKLEFQSTYSGRLTENLTQALCRDLLVDAMSRLEKKGYEVIAHIHDEIICESENGSIHEMEEIMRQVPPWATWKDEPFPIGCEGYETGFGGRYRK